MNNAIAKLLQSYDVELARFTPKRIEDAAEGNNSLGHLRWLIQAMLTEGHAWSDLKVGQRLGFIQGTMWMSGVRGIQKIKGECSHLDTDGTWVIS